MTYGAIHRRSREKWEALYSSGIIHILVGTATCGRAAGSMPVLEAFRRQIDGLGDGVRVSEVGCIGLCSQEPLVIIVKPGDFSVCYHHVTPRIVPQLVEGYVRGNDPCLDLALGTVSGGGDEAAFIPELELFHHQSRVLLRNCGYNSPQDIDHYIAGGGYAGLAAALGMKPSRILNEIKRSGLRGRGGAGYPTAAKWADCLKAGGSVRYVICNADEGDPGAFMDRVLLESDPHAVIEGMIIAGYTVGAKQGYIYIREEYPLAIERINIALDQARGKGLLGRHVLDSGFSFTAKVVRGAGAFVSGEETAMIAAMEGRRSWPEHRPPYPAQAGLRGKPTLVNNVKTLAYVPIILQKGWRWFRSIGTKESPGTALFAMAGKLENAGLAEVPMGTSLRTLVYGIGGGVKQGGQFKAVQIGGPSGGCLPESLLDTPIDFDSLKEAGVIMGSGGVIVMDEDNCMVDTARFFVDFSRHESCGKCTFCRIGTFHMHSILDDITRGKGSIKALEALQGLAEDIRSGSLCGLGRASSNPVLTTLRYFREEYAAHVLEQRCPARVCKDLTGYYILPQKCQKGCDHCVLACPAEAIFSDEKGIKVVDQPKCTKCGSCELVCPAEYNAVIRLSPVSLIPADRYTRPDTKEP